MTPAPLRVPTVLERELDCTSCVLVDPEVVTVEVSAVLVDV